MVKKGTRLGIGHTAPSGLLHLRGSNTAKIILENTDNATNIDIDYYGNGDAVQSRIRYGEGPGAFYFHPNASSGSAVSMLYDGKVGIGTASPGSLLEVYEDDPSAGNTQLHIHNNKTDDAAVLKLEGKRSSANDFGQLLFNNNGNN